MLKSRSVFSPATPMQWPFPRGGQVILRYQRRITQPAALALAVAVLGVLPTATAAGAYAAAPDRAPGTAPAASTHDPADSQAHDLPGPFSKQQSAERSAALQQVVAGQATVQQIGASKVVQLGSGKGKKSKYVELGREKTDKIFTILAEFGDQVDSTTTYDPDGPDGPEAPVTKYGGTAGPGAQHHRQARPGHRQQHRLAGRLQPGALPGPVLLAPARTGVAGEVLREAVLGPLLGRRRGLRLGQGPLQRGPLRLQLLRQHHCASAWYAVRDGVNAWVAERRRPRAHRRRRSRRTWPSSTSGTATTTTATATSTSPTATSTTSRSCTPARTSPPAAARRATDAHLGAPLVRLRHRRRRAPARPPTRRGGTQIGDTGIWVGDYTIQPENGGLGVFAHEYGHDLGLPDEYDTTVRRRELHRLLDADVVRLLARHRQERHRRPARRHERLGQAPAGLAGLRRRQGRDAAPPPSWASPSTTPRTSRRSWSQLPEKKVTTTIVTPAEGATQWWSGSGDNLRNTLTRSVDLTGKSSAVAHPRRLVGHRGGLRLPLHRGLHGRRRQLDRARRHRPTAVAIPRDGGGKPRR